MRIINIILLVPILSFSQITVNDSNLPSIGDTIIMAYEYGSYSQGNSGPNQNWNFSSANGSIDMVLGFIDPNTTPYASSFTNSNLCVQIDSAAYYYLNTSTNGLVTNGFVDQGMIYDYNQIMLPTPLNYLDTITISNIIFQYDTVISPPFPSVFIGLPGPYVIDSIRQSYGKIQEYIVDGWGQVEIPNGNYDALRVYESMYEFDNIMMKITDTITGTSQWIQDPTTPADTLWEQSRYVWRTNDSTIKFNLAEIETDSLGNALGDIYYYMGNSISNLVISPPMVEEDAVIDVNCNGEATGKIIIDIIGSAYPFNFSWTGPNGFTSSSQNIYNLYSGLYTLIVTDSNGNSSIESFFIDEPPVLTLSIIQNGYNLIADENGGTPPYSYLWNPTNDTTNTITANTNGLYSCEITDKKGCIVYADFNVINIPTNIDQINNKRKIIKIHDLLGKESIIRKYNSLIYIYDDGSIEKNIIVD